MNKKVAKLGLFTATSFVVANMVGTGVFTSLGFQLADIQNPLVIAALWVAGGVIALCGAMVYGELGAAMPRSGGEYNFLSKIYHPSVGFLGGWVSATIGFAAPVALACVAFGKYFHGVIPDLNPTVSALVILALITIVHSVDVKSGGRFQNVFTVLKISFIVFFIIAAFFFSKDTQVLSFNFDHVAGDSILSAAFFISLVYVTYAYSGWNAAAYFVNDLENPTKTLPRALLIGTAIVTILYVLLNLAFLYVAPVYEMKGQLEIGFIAANHIFGANIGSLMSGAISLLLVSSISSMVFAGPRVTQVMGEDFRLLKFLAYKNNRNVPIVAVWVQFALSFVLILTATFDALLTYTGFVLNFFAMLTVIGVFVHRFRFPQAERPVKTPGYPVVPLIFAGMNIAIMIFLIKLRPAESVYGALTVVAGAVLYFADKLTLRKKVSEDR